MTDECKCHGKVMEKLKHLEEGVSHHASMWEAIKDRVSMSTFRWIIGILFMVTISLYGHIIYSQRIIQQTLIQNTTDIAVMSATLKQIKEGM